MLKRKEDIEILKQIDEQIENEIGCLNYMIDYCTSHSQDALNYVLNFNETIETRQYKYDFLSEEYNKLIHIIKESGYQYYYNEDEIDNGVIIFLRDYTNEEINKVLNNYDTLDNKIMRGSYSLGIDGLFPNTIYIENRQGIEKELEWDYKCHTNKNSYMQESFDSNIDHKHNKYIISFGNTLSNEYYSDDVTLRDCFNKFVHKFSWIKQEMGSKYDIDMNLVGFEIMNLTSLTKELYRYNQEKDKFIRYQVNRNIPV